MFPRLLLSLGMVMALQAQEQPQQTDPKDLLLRARAQVVDSVSKLPRYMCTQTIDRAQFDASTQRNTNCEENPKGHRTQMNTSDRLRLDVAMAIDREMYTWVGEHRFGDRDLLEMIKEGAISTGTYSDFLDGIFRSEDTDFSYDGDTSDNGRDLAEFGFRMPTDRSHYLWGRRGAQTVIGYDGTFLLDRKSGDLVRLVIRTNRLPEETGACYATHTMDYSRELIQGAYFYLPKQSFLRIVTPKSVAENRTTFSACHEFLGESTVSFGGPPEDPDTRQVASFGQHLAIPPGLIFRVALTQGFNTATSAAGDAVSAKLLTPIKDHDKVLVSAGAAITARVSRLRLYYGKQPKVILEVRLESVEVEGGPIPLAAMPEIGSRFQNKSGILKRRVDLGTIRNLEERSTSYEFDLSQQPYLIKSGLESLWVTAAAK
jgi:hypothetical protein